MEPEEPGRLESSVLLHLLAHRGAQVRFEADQWTTEFGILRAFSEEDANELKLALRRLLNGRSVYRRVQYVIGYSEPKAIYALTPSGHRLALNLNDGAVHEKESLGGSALLPSHSGKNGRASPSERAHSRGPVPSPR